MPFSDILYISTGNDIKKKIKKIIKTFTFLPILCDSGSLTM